MSKTEFEKPLPQTAWGIPPGRIYAQKKKCGKTNCKCAHGEMHIAFYFFTRVNGKQKKIYIPKAKLETYNRIIEEAREKRDRIRQTLKASSEHLKFLTKQWR